MKQYMIWVSMLSIDIFFFVPIKQNQMLTQEENIGILDFLKSRLAELEIDNRGGIYRSKVNCLRVCTNGPIAVVYPDAVWYQNCTPEVLERIIQEHLIGEELLMSMLFQSRVDGLE